MILLGDIRWFLMLKNKYKGNYILRKDDDTAFIKMAEIVDVKMKYNEVYIKFYVRGEDLPRGWTRLKSSMQGRGLSDRYKVVSKDKVIALIV